MSDAERRAQQARDVERLGRQANRELAQMLVEREARTAAAFDEARRRIVERMRRSGSAIPDENRMRRLVLDELDRAASRAVPIVERTIRDATASGLRTARMLGGVQSIRVENDASAQHAASVAAARAFQAVHVDVRSVSESLTSRTRATAQALAAEVQSTVQAGTGIVQAARSLARADDVRIALPQAAAHIARIVETNGSDRELARAAKAFSRHVARLGSATQSDLSIRGAAQRLEFAAARGARADIAARLDEFVIRKARYEATRLVRTESSRARNAAFVSATRDSDAVVGMKWNLSKSHPRADICDVFASQDVAGLGAGVYPKNDLPTMPPHANCLCFWTAEIASVQSRERRLAELRGEAPPPERPDTGRRDTPDAWLRAQPANVRREIVGEARSKLLEQGRSAMSRNGALTPIAAGRSGTIGTVRVVGGFLPSSTIRVPPVGAGRRSP